jgi:hypothetical protein
MKTPTDADAFVVALAHARPAQVLTGDQESESVTGLVVVQWLPVHG